MNKNKLYIKDLISNPGKIDLQLSIVAGENGLNREITSPDVNRPGLGLAGFFDFFAYSRIQIFGMGENAFLKELPQERKGEIYKSFFSYDVTCSVFTHDEQPDELFKKLANSHNVPTFVSKHRTTRFISLLTHVIEEYFSPSTVVHGTLVDVFGVGVLLMGRSGVGKSECALELIVRGHRLIGDDMVEIKKIDESLLVGSRSDIIGHHMEIRGLGIINIREIFGTRSMRNRKRIDLVVLLEEWDVKKEYDRLGIDEKKYSILDLEVPFITLPVRPGRNIPIIVEAAALNERLKKMGIHSARELDEKIINWMNTESANIDEREGSIRQD